MPKIGVVSATIKSVAPLTDCFRRIAPEAEVAHFVNDELLAMTNRNGGVGPRELRAFMRLFLQAAESDAEVLLLSCTVFCPYIELFRSFTEKPVLAIDQPMLSRAAELGGAIGVVATNEATARGTREQIETLASARGVGADVRTACCPDAAARLSAGDRAGHDAIVAGAAAGLVAGGCETIVLAQISMAEAAALVRGARVLTSVEEGVRAALSARSATGGKPSDGAGAVTGGAPGR